MEIFKGDKSVDLIKKKSTRITTKKKNNDTAYKIANQPALNQTHKTVTTSSPPHVFHSK